MRSKGEDKLIVFGVLLVLLGWFLGLETEKLLIEKGVHQLKNGKVEFVKDTTNSTNLNADRHKIKIIDDSIAHYKQLYVAELDVQRLKIQKK